MILHGAALVLIQVLHAVFVLLLVRKLSFTALVHGYIFSHEKFRDSTVIHALSILFVEIPDRETTAA